MSLLLGKTIYSILSGDTTIKSYVNNKIYPIFAPDETVNPFIVYECRTINAFYTKDGLSYDDAEVVVNVISDNYTEAITISNAVRSALELNVGVFNDLTIYRSLVSNFSINYGVDGYIATLTLSISCK